MAARANGLLFEEQISTMEMLLESGVSEKDACIAVGISLTSFSRYKQDPVILDRVQRAKLRSKADLIRVAHVAATKGFKIKEKITTEVPVENPDGSTTLQVAKIVTIEKELPPDMKANNALLKARFPEEFGNINRLDMKKIGSAGQVDQEGQPMEIANPMEALDLILKGNSYVLPELTESELPPEAPIEIPEQKEEDENW